MEEKLTGRFFTARETLFIGGGPYTGKSTQRLRLRVPGFGTGDLLRDHMKRHTPTGREVSRIVDRGDLVPDEIMIPFFLNNYRLIAQDAAQAFDGAVRTKGQAIAIERIMLETYKRATPIYMLDLELEEEEAIRRMRARGRPDDKIEAALEREEEFKRHHPALMEFVTRAGSPWSVSSIDAHGSKDEVFARVCAALEIGDSARPLPRFRKAQIAESLRSDFEV